MLEKPTFCPRCRSNDIYIVMSLGEEEEISCGNCGFMGKVEITTSK